MRRVLTYRTAVTAPPVSSGTGLRERFEAAAGSADGLVATGRTAAWIHGFDVLPPGVPEHQWPLECASGLPERDTTTVDGLPVTRRARTLVDCAADLPRLEAVAAADQFMRAGISARALAEVLKPLRGDRLRAVNATLLAADPRAESPMESWARCLITDAGLPTPTPRLRVRSPGGRTVSVGLGWKDLRVGVEYDGMAPPTGPAADGEDPRRHGELGSLGWQVLVLNAGDVMEHPRRWLEDLRELLLERGWDPDLTDLHDISARIDAVEEAMTRGLPGRPRATARLRAPAQGASRAPGPKPG